jgi:hypothetical protein
MKEREELGVPVSQSWMTATLPNDERGGMNDEPSTVFIVHPSSFIVLPRFGRRSQWVLIAGRTRIADVVVAEVLLRRHGSQTPHAEVPARALGHLARRRVGEHGGTSKPETRNQKPEKEADT